VRIIRRYLLAEIAGPFALGLGIILVLFLIQKIFVITDWAMNRGVSLWDILRLLLYLMPLILYIVLPMVTLFALLLALSRLSSDSEIIALKASGVSLYRLLPTLLLFAALVFAVCLSLALEWIPRAQRQSRELRYHIVQRFSEAGITPRTFLDFLPQMVFYVRESDAAGLRGVMISQELKPKGPAGASPDEIRMAFAERGRFLHNPETLENVLLLENGSLQLHDLKRDVYQTAEFEQCRIRLDFEQDQDPGEMALEEMGLGDLLARRQELRSALQQPALTNAAGKKLRKEWRDLRVSLHEKLAFSCGCLILAFWAVPLGIQPPRSGRLRSIILSIFLAGIYNYLLVLGKALALKGIMDPAAVLWLPNAAILLSGLYLLDCKARERPVPVLTWLEDLTSHLEKRLRRRFGRPGDAA
jgi:lipopolysaccharide export system permease protein